MSFYQPTAIASYVGKVGLRVIATRRRDEQVEIEFGRDIYTALEEYKVEERVREATRNALAGEFPTDFESEDEMIDFLIEDDDVLDVLASASDSLLTEHYAAREKLLDYRRLRKEFLGVWGVVLQPLKPAEWDSYLANLLDRRREYFFEKHGKDADAVLGEAVNYRVDRVGRDAIRTELRSDNPHGE